MVGATGPDAGMVLPELKHRGAMVRALVRSADRAAARRTGADETAIGYLTEPDTLREAVRGVEDVFHINPAFVTTTPSTTS
jgi:uncharacterized protein YbjT (DUF2867 family)